MIPKSAYSSPIPPVTIMLPSGTNKTLERLKSVRDKDLAPQLPYFLKGLK